MYKIKSKGYQQSHGNSKVFRPRVVKEGLPGRNLALDETFKRGHCFPGSVSARVILEKAFCSYERSAECF